MIVYRVARRIVRLGWFVLWYLWELVKANAYVAWEVITPGTSIRPGIIACPIRARSELEITLLANLITMTPGTLTLDLSPDEHVLYVHGLHVRDPDHLRAQVWTLERRLLAVLR
jgi:multicomponent Na+:H+ antiporter subunit E